MPTFDVDIGKQTYEVDAPDERTAWAWANQTHQNDEQEKKKAVDTEVASMREGNALVRGARGAGAGARGAAIAAAGLAAAGRRWPRGAGRRCRGPGTSACDSSPPAVGHNG